MLKEFAASLIFALISSAAYPGEGLPEVIDRVKPSILAIGTYKKTQSPPFAFCGTGFVIGNGKQAVTNAHALPESSPENDSILVVLIQPHRRLKLIHGKDAHGIFRAPAGQVSLSRP